MVGPALATVVAVAAVTIAMLAALSQAQGSSCACDGIVPNGASSGCGDNTGVDFLVQNGVCGGTCDTEFYVFPSQANPCKSRQWCRARNCQSYPTNDCSICLNCAAGYELALVAQAGRFRPCVPFENPVLTCPLITADLGESESSMPVSFNVTATDNVAVASGSLSCTPASGTVFGMGNQEVVCTVLDVNNNQGTCTFTVRVRDRIPPVMIFQATYTESVPENVTQAVVEWSKPTATDNVDGNLPVTCNRNVSNTVFPLGSTIIFCSAIDSSLNQAVAYITVLVLDPSGPSISCPSIVIKALGSFNVVQVFFQVNATDATDPNPSVTCSPSSGSLFAYGPTSVDCTASSFAAKQASCSFVVETMDLTPPVIVCPSNLVVSPPTGQSDIAVTWSAPNAYDNVGVVGFPTCSPTSGTTMGVGTFTIACSVFDAANNEASCQFSVTVLDTEPPVIECPAPAAVTLAAQTNTITYSWTVTATDNSNSVSWSCNPSPGSIFETGTTAVLCTAVDEADNSAQCIFTITVEDKENPVITCPADISSNTDAGSNRAVVYFDQPTVTDNVEARNASCSRSSGYAFGVGRNTVVCTGTDSSNNIASCTFDVDVDDVEPPVVTCPNSTTATINREDSDATVIQSAPSAVDNVRVQLERYYSNNVNVIVLPTVFPVGVTTLAYEALDSSANSRICSWTVTVNQIGDFDPPNITNCPPPTSTVATDAKARTYNPLWIPDVFEDGEAMNCSDARITCKYLTFPQSGLIGVSPFPLGFTRVLFSATDLAGNIGTCQFDIVVEDREPPEVVCPPDRDVVASGGASTAVVAWSAPLATDNVVIKNTSLSDVSGSNFPIGTTTVTFVAADLAGNQASCTFEVTVVAPAEAGASSENASVGIVGGLSFAVIVAILLVGFLFYRRSRAKLQHLEEDLAFRENEEWIMARAQAISVGAAHRQRGPGARDLEAPIAGGRGLNAPPADLMDLQDLNVYMPYESVAREYERDRVELEYEIGNGEFGSVWAGRITMLDGKTQQTAIKMLKAATDEKNVVAFRQEIAIVGQLENPKIVSLLGYVTKSEPALMCLEFMELGNLKGFLSTDKIRGTLTERDMIMMALDVASGMHYVGTMGLVHRDLAARNVLVNKNLECKVADFGLCVELMGEPFVNKRDSTEKLPVRWTAVEAITEGRWSPASDVWSFGVVLHEMWTYGQLPYRGWSNAKVSMEVTQNEYRLSPPPGSPSVIYAIMLDCWLADLESRLSFRRAYRRLVAAWDECASAEERNYDFATDMQGADGGDEDGDSAAEADMLHTDLDPDEVLVNVASLRGLQFMPDDIDELDNDPDVVEMETFSEQPAKKVSYAPNLGGTSFKSAAGSSLTANNRVGKAGLPHEVIAINPGFE